jgi:hypothetical protein
MWPHARSPSTRQPAGPDQHRAQRNTARSAFACAAVASTETTANIQHFRESLPGTACKGAQLCQLGLHHLLSCHCGSQCTASSAASPTVCGTAEHAWLALLAVRTCALVSLCMSDNRPQSALQPNLLNEANSKGASHIPSPQTGSTQTACTALLAVCSSAKCCQGPGATCTNLPCTAAGQ